MPARIKPTPPVSKIADFIGKRIDALQSRKNQREIAEEMGYDRPNVVSMFKNGKMKVPLDRIPQIAEALEVDPGLMFRMALEEYWPDRQATITQIFGRPLTMNERKIVDYIRVASSNSDPELTPALKAAIDEVYKPASALVS